MASGTFDGAIKDAMAPKANAAPPKASHSINQKSLKGHRPPPKPATQHNPDAVAPTPGPPLQHQTAGGQPMLTGSQTSGDNGMGDLARAHTTIVNHLASRIR